MPLPGPLGGERRLGREVPGSWGPRGPLRVTRGASSRDKGAKSREQCPHGLLGGRGLRNRPGLSEPGVPGLSCRERPRVLSSPFLREACLWSPGQPSPTEGLDHLRTALHVTSLGSAQDLSAENRHGRELGLVDGGHGPTLKGWKLRPEGVALLGPRLEPPADGLLAASPRRSSPVSCRPRTLPAGRAKPPPWLCTCPRCPRLKKTHWRPGRRDGDLWSLRLCPL